MFRPLTALKHPPPRGGAGALRHRLAEVAAQLLGEFTADAHRDRKGWGARQIVDLWNSVKPQEIEDFAVLE